MRLPRPYIPLSVRIAVCERQALPADCLAAPIGPLAARLAFLLDRMFGGAVVHLDHDPPLGAREKKILRDGAIVSYRPDANDPEHLIYRVADAHRIKTNVRGEHGQHPDRVLIKRQRRRERAEKGAPKYNPKNNRPVSRPISGGKRWPPKGARKLRGRPFRARPIA